MHESLLDPEKAGGIRGLKNCSVSPRQAPSFLRVQNVATVRSFHKSIPGYAVTPLKELKTLARELGVKNILVKDESERFGLKAFKGLGGSYAVFKALCRKLGLAPERTTFADLQAPEIQKVIADIVFITATDGNHGKGVAWAAGQLGCKSVVYMPQGSSEARAQAIRDAGMAEVTITDLGYDDTVRFASRQAEEHGWVLVQDTSWDGYEEVPTWIVQGYTTLAAEAADQLDEKGLVPTHVFLQAGVGAMAGGVLGYLLDRYAGSRPVFSIVESIAAACIYESASIGDGAPHSVEDTGPTIMAGLYCCEPCTVTWPLLRDFAGYYFACPDYVAAEGMRVYSRPLGNDDPLVSGESGAAPFGLLLHLLRSDALLHAKEEMRLDQNAVILLVNTEGDTDPAVYRDIIMNGIYPSPLLRDSGPV